MQRKKIDLKKVMESLNTTCPLCGFSITPDKVQRLDFTRIKCPSCGQVFDAGKVRKAD